MNIALVSRNISFSTVWMYILKNDLIKFNKNIYHLFIFVLVLYQYVLYIPYVTLEHKTSLQFWGIFVEIAKNTLNGSKL